MKIYVHYGNTPEYTHIVEDPNKDPIKTVQQVLVEFAEGFNGKHGDTLLLDPAILGLYPSDAYKAPLSPAVTLRPRWHRRDFFVRSKKKEQPKQKAPIQSKEEDKEEEEEKEEVGGLLHIDADGDMGPKGLPYDGIPRDVELLPIPFKYVVESHPIPFCSLPVTPDGTPHPKLRVWLVDTLKQGASYVSIKNYRAAKLVMGYVMQFIPDQVACLDISTTIALECKEWKTAIDFAQRAVAASKSPLRLLKVAEAYVGAGNDNKALQAFKEVGKEIHHKKKRKLTQREAKVSRDARSGMANIFIQRNRLAEGARLHMEVLEEEDSHPESALAYSRLLSREGKIYDAIHLLLRSLMVNQKHKGLQQLLSDLALTEKGLDTIQSTITPSATNAVGVASAMSWISIIVRDGGAIDSHLQFSRVTYSFLPTSASYFLTYMHALELVGEVKKAAVAIVRFCAEYPQRMVADVQMGRVASACIGHAGEWDDLLSELGPEVVSKMLMEWKGLDSNEEDEASLAAYLKEGDGKEVKENDLGQDTLDMLACCFTLIKIMYLQGWMPLARRVVRIIDSARWGRDIHHTTIRNEQAYYLSVAKLLAGYPVPWPVQHDMPSIYVCGDSHCVPLAWRVIQVEGVPHILRPALVTGMKMWHVRESSKFYPKKSFKRVVETIPPKSTVIFLFGEIDCREGFLHAVERCLYESIEEAAHVAIHHYLKAVLRVTRARQFRALMHPIVPALDITRHIVRRAQKVLVPILEEEYKSLHYLNFFDELLTEDGLSLKPELRFDETHMSPKYIPWLEREINKAMQVMVKTRRRAKKGK